MRTWLPALGQADREAFRFLHVSTDEVFGALGAEGAFTERSQYAPNSPYAASKAASDHMVRAHHHTYGLPRLTTNCSNNYGPYQFCEKLIPLMIGCALRGQPLPVYDKGQQGRDWIFVLDHCRALFAVLEGGQPGGSWCVGAHTERTNINVVHTLCDALDRRSPRSDGASYRAQIHFVADRPGHDYRYAVDATKLRDELGWALQVDFEQGLMQTVEWYLGHRGWWQPPG